MKVRQPATLQLPRFHRAWRRRQSSALLVVLGCLVLISVLIVAFFYAVTAERQSAQFYANTSSVKLLADSTVSIVEGQIADATTGTNSSGSTLSWASQPGMIRNYNTSGQAAGYYKLFSATNMVATSGAYDPTKNDVPPSTWAASPAVYSDLNDPITSGGYTDYPIVDPAALSTASGGLGVQGFYTNSSVPATSTSHDTLPMPVRWLYVLQQGQVITPDPSSSGNTATFTQSPIQPNATNAIAGRIAFWTDDDTCKVNINTAAGDVWFTPTTTSPSPGVNTGNPGSFWDTPRVYSGYETNLALYQPAQGEYQRYPGHPATTYLSAVFPNILTTAASIFAIAPRVSLGGSLSGTTYPTASMLTNCDSDRLYSSVDELLFSATNVTAATPPLRVPNAPAPATVTLNRANIEQARFFLTAASRAPEVNLYNQPRVVIWPVSTGTVTGVNRTPYDNLIAYCGTLNGNAYYFQRGITSTTAGANNPGGESSANNPNISTSDLPPTGSSTGLGRNRQLITYLRNLTSLPVPGFSTGGESFYSKYSAPVGSNNGKDRDQILTEIFDYIRSLNTQDQGVTTPYTPSTWLASGEGQIAPIQDTATDGTTALRGFGHLPVIAEASLLFINRAETSADATQTSNNTLLDPTYPAAGSVQPGKARIQAALLLKWYDCSQGYADFNPKYEVVTTGLSGMQWSTSGVGASSVGFNDPATELLNVFAGISWGVGEQGIYPFTASNSFNTASTGYVGKNTMDCTSGGTFSINDTTFKVQLYDSPGKTMLYQTYNLEFPAGTFPVPLLAPLVYDSSPLFASTPTIPYISDFRNMSTTVTQSMVAPNDTLAPTTVTIGGRFNPYGNIAGSNMLQTSFCSRDVVRSIILNTDPRLVGGLQTVPSSYYTKAAGYDTTTLNLAHGIIAISNGNHRPYPGALFGKLVAGASYSGNTSPYSPAVGAGTDFFYAIPTGTATPPAGPGVQPWAVCAVETARSTPITWNGSTFSTLGSIPSGVPKSIILPDPGIYTASGGYAVGAPGVFLPGSSTLNGDWDTGAGSEKDGAYINKADEGAIEYNTGATFTSGLQIPYYGAGYKTSITTGSGSIQITQGANFSPNRQMPSAGMFGSLPTGVIAQRPFQTLLFRPSPDGNVLPSETPAHIGAQSPQDHLLMDLFNMPIVEPYAISDPFSTAGKVNMNYQIVPFTYITRSTAIQAVMRSEQILAIPVTSAGSYKGASSANLRHYLDLGDGVSGSSPTQGTLVGFQNMFTKGTPDGLTNLGPDIFRSASQICNIWLVPVGQTYSGMQAFWQSALATGGGLTGDNVRERPYTNIYARLTTKSNTYTVHMRVQTLKQVKSVDPTYASWVEGSDVITGEYRGSSTLERYLDTSDTTIPDYATATSPPPIDNFYKFRVVETKQFTP